MKILYFDCQMGAAGDMITASLLEHFEDKNKIVEELNNIGIEGVKYIATNDSKCGIEGTHLTVLVDGIEESSDMHDHHHDHGHEHDHSHHNHEHDHNHEHHSHDHDHNHDHEHAHHHSHSSLHDIEHIVKGHLNLPDKVKEDVMSIYKIIAEAEASVHGKTINDIHFHEVGTKDAIADICGACLLMYKLGPDKVYASPVHVGSGQVKCAHGILPVPAPATAHILKGVPVYGGNIKSELCTPTGAAILKYFVSEFKSMPLISIDSVGYGTGKKDFEMANCVRTVVGLSVDSIEGNEVDSEISSQGTVIELSFNVDDMTGEAVGFLMQKLFEAGAVEVFSESIYMKKNRPGIKISLLCQNEMKDKLIPIVFKYSTTIGIREQVYSRYTLNRSIELVHTSIGDVRIKKSSGYGVEKEKYEYDDLIKLAEDNNLSLDEVLDIIHSEE